MTKDFSSFHTFHFSRSDFEELTKQTLDFAKKLGATSSYVEVSENLGLNVQVRKQNLENIEENHGKSLNVSIYLNQSSGASSTSDFSLKSLKETVQAAFDIAKFTAKDKFSGLPNLEDLDLEINKKQDLKLFIPWEINVEQAKNLALECEESALNFDKKITNSEGANVSSSQGHFFMANSLGFSGGYASSSHGISVSPIASQNDKMQRDFWFSSKRNPEKLLSATEIGKIAAQRTLRKLNGQKISTRKCPVLFEAPIALGLLGNLVGSLSGGRLYQKNSFLVDSLGKQVLPTHIFIEEDPFILEGKSSCYFDGEGVKVQKRKIIDSGIVQGYFLSSYSARKLKMKTTGNSGGSHNLFLKSSLTKSEDNFVEMLKKLDNGLLVTELLGQGVNYVNGDYSRGASGFWIENGEIKFPVHEITIAGNLKEMFLNIEAIGSDYFESGGKTSGSVLINQMKIAGN